MTVDWDKEARVPLDPLRIPPEVSGARFGICDSCNGIGTKGT